MVVEEFQREVEACLFELVDAGDAALSLDEKLAFFKKERRSLGQSALCLSGGGSICMYHLGTLKALIEVSGESQAPFVHSIHELMMGVLLACLFAII